MRIMVVDDQKDVLDTIGSVLRNEGYKVILESNGKDCLNCLDKCTDKVIFLDIMMPGMDGYDVAKKIKDIDNNIKIIFVSIKPKAEVDMSLADSFIQKPFEINKIINEAKSCCKGCE